LSSAAQIQFDAQLALFRDTGQAVLESVEKLMHLNLAATRASMLDSSSAARDMLSANGAGDAMSVVRAQAGPSIGKAIAYGNHVVNIATATQADLTRAAE